MFTPNRRGIGQVADSVEVRRALRKVAESQMSEAVRTAPVATGAYRDSIHLEEDTSPDGRARVFVVADDPKSAALEYGTADTPRFRTLGIAANVKE